MGVFSIDKIVSKKKKKGKNLTHDQFSRSRAQVARKRASIVARTDAVREPSAYGTVRYSCAGVHPVPVDRRISSARQVRDGLLTV